MNTKVEKQSCYRCKHSTPCYRWKGNLMIVSCTKLDKTIPERINCDTFEPQALWDPHCCEV